MYTLKRGDQQYTAQDLGVLQQWANAGSVFPTDMIFDPQSNQWIQASQFPQIMDIIAQRGGAVQAQQQAQQAAQQAAQQQARANFIVVNTEQIPGMEVESVFGLVQGSTVRTKHLGKDILAGLKNLIGGEVSEYTEMLNESRKLATDRMVWNAMQMGANAVINTRYATSSIAQGMAEILAYGTAVKVKRGG